MHRLTRIVSTMLITAGLVVLADGGLTLLWQEPLCAAGFLQGGGGDEHLAPDGEPLHAPGQVHV